MLQKCRPAAPRLKPCKRPAPATSPRRCAQVFASQKRALWSLVVRGFRLAARPAPIGGDGVALSIAETQAQFHARRNRSSGGNGSILCIADKDEPTFQNALIGETFEESVEVR